MQHSDIITNCMDRISYSTEHTQEDNLALIQSLEHDENISTYRYTKPPIVAQKLSSYTWSSQESQGLFGVWLMHETWHEKGDIKIPHIYQVYIQ